MERCDICGHDAYYCGCMAEAVEKTPEASTLLRILKRAGIVALAITWMLLGCYLILGTFMFDVYKWWGIVSHFLVGAVYIASGEEVMTLLIKLTEANMPRSEP